MTEVFRVPAEVGRPSLELHRPPVEVFRAMLDLCTPLAEAFKCARAQSISQYVDARQLNIPT